MLFSEQKIKLVKEKQERLSNLLYGELIGIKVGQNCIPGIFMWKEKKARLFTLSDDWEKFITNFELLEITENLEVKYEKIPINAKTEFQRCMADYKRRLENKQFQEVYNTNQEDIDKFLMSLSEVIAETEEK